VAPAAPEDLPALRRAATGSQARIRTWGPGGLTSIDALGAAPQPDDDHVTFLVHALEPTGEHAIAARINLTTIVRGRLAGAMLGYDAFDPYAGRGLTREGLALALDVCFAPEPDGLGLHRIAADVQPANVRSAGLLRSLGFVHEGHARRLVNIPTLGDPSDDWRDHDRYALHAEDWPGAAAVEEAAWRPARRPRLACLVNGIPGSGKSTLAAQLALELGVPLLRKDAIKEAVADALPAHLLVDQTGGQSALGAGASLSVWALLAESPIGAVVESWFWPHDSGFVLAGLARADLDAAVIPEIWCEVPVELARRRDAARYAAGDRHGIHGTPGSDARWAQTAAAARPLALGPVLRVDTSAPVSAAQVCRLALAVRAAAGAPPTAGSRYSATTSG